MRVYCPKCGKKSCITSNNKLSENVTRLYCACMDIENCGVRFTSMLSFEHYLIDTATKSAQNQIGKILTALSKLPKQEVERALKEYLTDLSG